MKAKSPVELLYHAVNKSCMQSLMKLSKRELAEKVWGLNLEIAVLSIKNEKAKKRDRVRR